MTLLASIILRRLGPCLAVEGASTREVFEAYLEHVSAPGLCPEQTKVMDNLSAHKGGRVKEIVEGRGCELLYLPSYSPHLNSIEQAFSKVTGLLRRAEEHTREALMFDGPTAVTDALSRRPRPSGATCWCCEDCVRARRSCLNSGGTAASGVRSAVRWSPGSP